MKKKLILCKVVRKKMNKTCIGILSKKIKHKKYDKYVNKIIKLYIHDENNVSKPGDFIYVKECKPISKTKFWVFIHKK